MPNKSLANINEFAVLSKYITCVNSPGAWIITGGMNAGVMKHVGEAVRDYQVAHGNKKQIAAIAIAPWGAVNNKECLVNDNCKVID